MSQKSSSKQCKVEEPPEMSEVDEAILDRVWDDVNKPSSVEQAKLILKSKSE